MTLERDADLPSHTSWARTAVADAPSSVPRTTARSPRPSAAALVLFVGSGCRPGPAECDVLGRDGMRCVWVPDLGQACDAAHGAQLDAIVVDARLWARHRHVEPSRLRDATDGPIVVLADDVDEVDEILALEWGADAFLGRPVTPRRLRAHLAGLMRLRQRTERAPDASRLMRTDAHDVHPAGPAWTVDRVANLLRRPGRDVALTDAQCALMQSLLSSGGRIVPRERLAHALPTGLDVHVRSVDVCIHRLRRRLLAEGVLDLRIETVRGRGYVMRSAAS